VTNLYVCFKKKQFHILSSNVVKINLGGVSNVSPSYQYNQRIIL